MMWGRLSACGPVVNRSWRTKLAWPLPCLLLVACSSRPPALADYVPPGAVLIAGARPDALRGTPLYDRIPNRDASEVWAVFNGTDLLFIAQAGREVKLSGSQTLLQAAQAQRQKGTPGSPDLLAQASAAAKGHALWIATRGRINLPLSGDAANVNRFLRLADFATAGLQPGAPSRLDFTAQCPTAEAAQNLEESLRAFLSLSALGAAKQPEIAAMLRSAEVRRDGREVRATISGDAAKVVDLFSR